MLMSWHVCLTCLPDSPVFDVVGCERRSWLERKLPLIVVTLAAQVNKIIFISFTKFEQHLPPSPPHYHKFSLAIVVNYNKAWSLSQYIRRTPQSLCCLSGIKPIVFLTPHSHQNRSWSVMEVNKYIAFPSIYYINTMYFTHQLRVAVGLSL